MTCVFTDDFINLPDKADFDFRYFCQRTEGLLSVVSRRSQDGDLDGAIRVDNMNKKRLVVVVGRVCRHAECDAEIDWTRGSDVVVIQRLRWVQRVFDDNAERP